MLAVCVGCQARVAPPWRTLRRRLSPIMIAKKQVGILALSAIADDPRVRRQGDAFHAAGWEVIAFGLPGSGRSAPPPWQIIGCDTANPPAQDFLDDAPNEFAADEGLSD